MGPSFVGLSAAVHSKIVCCSMQRCSLNSTRTLSGADLALQDTGALAAAEYGRLAVWEHSPLFFRAGRRLYRSWTVHECWCSISTVDSFSFLMLAFVCHAYPAFVLHPRSHLKSVRWFQVLFLGFVVRSDGPVFVVDVKTTTNKYQQLLSGSCCQVHVYCCT